MFGSFLPNLWSSYNQSVRSREPTLLCNQVGPSTKIILHGDTLGLMSEEKQFVVIYSPNLEWPSSLELPSRFRLFVAANVSDISTEVASDFALAALSRGMVYFCSWGQGCERFHDIVDEVIAEDDVRERKFAGPSTNYVYLA